MGMWGWEGWDEDGYGGEWYVEGQVLEGRWDLVHAYSMVESTTGSPSLPGERCGQP